MKKHTPGPWAFRGDVLEGGGATVMVPDVDFGAYTLGGDGRLNVGPEDRALIAAAPDLLEALEAFPGFNAEPDEIAAWTVQMSAAIAKAKGES